MTDSQKDDRDDDNTKRTQKYNIIYWSISHKHTYTQSKGTQETAKDNNKSNKTYST